MEKRMFCEWYGAYYNAVAKILREAAKSPVTRQRMQEIIREQAFSESILAVEPALLSGRYPFLFPDGTSRLKHAPTMPLTLLEKRWLKAVLLDPRVRLFECGIEGLEEIEPLFKSEDVRVFDRYGDGDPYQDETYIANFRLILSALKERRPLAVDVKNKRGVLTHMNVLPQYLEYSEKDDKFRLFTLGCRYGRIINLARILSVKYIEMEEKMEEWAKKYIEKPVINKESIVFELYDGRNTLERALLHFADFEKRAERLSGRHYRIKVVYNREDKTELVIRVLSFGPFLKVVEPEDFVEMIKERLANQYALTGEEGIAEENNL